MREINEIIIHCSATRPRWMADATADEKVEEIRRWHVEGNGWSDIGYHYVIDRNGVVVNGRPVRRAGAHCYGRNRHSVGVCLLGGHGSEAGDQFSDHFTDAQDEALREVITKLRGKFGAGVMVSGHNRYAAKACPGFRVNEWWHGVGRRPGAVSAAARMSADR